MRQVVSLGSIPGDAIHTPHATPLLSLEWDELVYFSYRLRINTLTFNIRYSWRLWYICFCNKKNSWHVICILVLNTVHDEIQFVTPRGVSVWRVVGETMYLISSIRKENDWRSRTAAQKVCTPWCCIAGNDCKCS